MLSHVSSRCFWLLAHSLRTVGQTKSYYQEPLNLSTSDKTFRAADLKVEKKTKLAELPAFDAKSIPFGARDTDHMLTINWNEEKGWATPKIEPMQPIEMHRFNSTLHYAVQCYEGLKAYKNTQGQVRLFRPQCNMHRFKITSQALCLPDFDGAELLKCIEQLVKLESRWIPTQRGFSLYVRPAHISMERTLGVKEAKNSQIFVVLSPTGPYYPSGFQPISLYCETEYIRSAPLGSGCFKMGSNYGPTIMPTLKAKAKGFTQILWLYDGRVGEVGTSNIFFVLKGKDGVKELITPELDGLILPGVTRDSIIKHVSSTMKDYRVVERRIHIDEIIEACRNKTLLEAFGAGTAVIVSPIDSIGFGNEKFSVPINPQTKAGDLAYRLFNDFLNIQEGKVAHPWSKKI